MDYSYIMNDISNEQFVAEYLKCWLNAMKTDDMVAAWHGYHDWTVMHMNRVLYPLACLLRACTESSCSNCCERTGKGEEDRCKYFCKMYAWTVQQEYYNIDFSLYNSYEQSVWSLEYAIEHENAEFVLGKGNAILHKGWFDEFAKLLPVKCGKARVIIGYDTFNENDLSKKIARAGNLLADERLKRSLADSPIIVILFPYTKHIKEVVKKGIKEPKQLIKICEFKKGNPDECKKENSEEFKLYDLTGKVLALEYANGQCISDALFEAYRKIAEKS